MDTSFERNRNGKDEWLTPPEIIGALGDFDLASYAPIVRPWETAKNCFTVEDNGLTKNWLGRVCYNPPYGNQTRKWLERMAQHSNGTTLIYAKTETSYFPQYIWNSTQAIMFLRGRLVLYNVDGTRAKNSAGGPSCLVAYGMNNARILEGSGSDGKFLYHQSENHYGVWHPFSGEWKVNGIGCNHYFDSQKDSERRL